MNFSTIFKKQKLLIVFFSNRLEITNLLTNRTISRKAIQPFSNSRTILSDYLRIEELMRSIIKELLPGLILGKMAVVVQLGEPMEDGITEIEKRAMADSSMHAGARIVYYSDKTNALTVKEALQIIKDKSNSMTF